MCQFGIIDHDSNLSDHLPLHIACKSAIFEVTGKPTDKNNVNSDVCVDRFRCDHGNLLSYYNATELLLQPVLDDINVTGLSLFHWPKGAHELQPVADDMNTTGLSPFDSPEGVRDLQPLLDDINAIDLSPFDSP